MALQRILIVTAAVVLALVGVLAVVGDGSRWPEPESPPLQGEAADVRTMSAHPVHSERALARLIREPQNTWSNVAFVLGGAFLLMTVSQRLARGVGLVLLAVGMGSFLYHASASLALRHLDVLAMYWLFLMAIGVCISAVVPGWRRRIEAYSTALFAASFVIAVGVTFFREITVLGMKPLSLHLATIVTAAILILTLAEVARRRETIGGALQLVGIVTLFGIAAACQTNDRPGRRLYRPDAFIQAHAIWHVLSAATFVWSVRFLDGATRAPAAAQNGLAVDAKDS